MGSIDYSGVKSEEQSPESDDNGDEINVNAFGVVLSHDDEVILKIRRNIEDISDSPYSFDDLETQATLKISNSGVQKFLKLYLL